MQERYTSLTSVTIQANKYLDNRYGHFAHNDLVSRPIGRRWHSKVKPSSAQQCAGFVHALRPNPSLWSMAMHHRTQIVYPHDVCIIALYLDLRPGSVLVESGTGSGSASAWFASVVAPSGRVCSFEFHAKRAAAARADFERLGIADVVSVTVADVLQDGFVDVPSQSADAVFLDLPAPYLMGGEVARVLKPNGVVCCFSPCVEQVQRSCEMLRRGGFHSVRTVTAPMKTYETRELIEGTPGFDEMECEVDGSSARKRRRVSEKDLKRLSRTAGRERVEVAQSGRHDGRVVRADMALRSRPFSSMKGHTSFLTFGRRARGDD